MKNFMQGGKGGIMTMILATLGLVLYVTMFDNILAAFVTLSSFTNASAYIAFSTVISIAPTVLFLAGVFGAGFAYYRGYKAATGGGINGFYLVVIGALEIILFVTLFGTIMTAMETIRTNANIADFIALSTVVTIAPTVLFLAGIFAGGATTVGGWKRRKKAKKSFSF